MILVCWLATVIVGTRFFVRRLDVFTLGYISTVIFFMPVLVPVYDVHFEVGVIYLTLLLLLLLASFFVGGTAATPSQFDRNAGSLRQALVLSLVVLAAFNAPFFLGTLGSKSEGGGLIHYTFSALLGMTLLTAWKLRRTWLLVLCAVGYLWLLLRGDRTQVVVSAIAVFLYHVAGANGSVRALFRGLKATHLLSGVAVLFVGLFGKVIYGAYYDTRTGGDYWSAIAVRLREMLEEPARHFEPYHTQSILNLVIHSGDRIPSDYLLSLPIQILPFAAEFGGDVHFQSSWLKYRYFTNWGADAGVSSNFFAEGYLLWGLAGSVLFASIYVGGLVLFNLLMRSRSAVVKVASCLGASFWAFYIHRSSLTQILAHEKRVLYVALAVGMLALTIRAVDTRFRRSRGV